MSIVGDTSKERLIALFIDHLIAFALMLFVVALVPEKFAVVKGVLFFLIYLAYFVVLEALWSRTLGKSCGSSTVALAIGSAPSSGAACESLRSIRCC